LHPWRYSPTFVRLGLWFVLPFIPSSTSTIQSRTTYLPQLSTWGRTSSKGILSWHPSDEPSLGWNH
jgi:hypothetical protein